MSKAGWFIPLLISCASIHAQDCREINGGDFHLLSYDQSKKYITNYRENTKRKQQTHTRAVYFSSNVFCLIDTFLRKDPDKWAGINIHFAAYNYMAVNDQSDPKQISLFFTAADQKKNSQYTAIEDFYNNLKQPVCGVATEHASSINHGELCPKVCDETTDSWGTMYRSSRAGGGVPEGSLNPYYTFLSKDTANAYKKNYRRKYCVLNRRHTKSIFMRPGLFTFIGQFLKDNPNCKGIGIYLAAYNAKAPSTVVGQTRKKQITVVIAPMMAINGKLEPDFCAFNRYYDANPGKMEVLKLKSGERADSGNHGELCPKACAPDDDN